VVALLNRFSKASYDSIANMTELDYWIWCDECMSDMANVTALECVVSEAD
jgi:hypothetical protein